LIGEAAEDADFGEGFALVKQQFLGVVQSA
jgi:hypothetical protein